MDFESTFEINCKLHMGVGRRLVHFLKSSSDLRNNHCFKTCYKDQSSSQTWSGKTFSIQQTTTNYDAFHSNVVSFSPVCGFLSETNDTAL